MTYPVHDDHDGVPYRHVPIPSAASSPSVDRPGALTREVPIPFATTTQRWIAIAAALCLGAWGVTIAFDAPRAWSGLCAAAFTFVAIAVGALAFLAAMQVSNAAWHVPVKRVPEAITVYLPVGGVTILALLIGLPDLYAWARPDVAHELHGKGAYLEPVFFAARAVAILAIWTLLAWRIRRRSLLQDRDHAVEHTRRIKALSAATLVILGLTFSVASFDWLMSLDPHWQSTIFGWYHIGGALLGGTAMIAVVAIQLRRRGLLPQMTDEHVHDLGKLTFGFSTLWAYLWLSQYLLVWYGNLPEETAWYVARTSGGWSFLFWANLFVNWVVPFLSLLPRPAKRSQEHLLRVCGLLLAGRWLDVWVHTGPATNPIHPGLGVAELAPVLGLGALFLLVVGRALSSRPTVPKGDPYLAEGSHYRS